jgi:hypothetical protein
MDEPKAELVRSWLTKAKRDLGSAERLANEPAPYLDTAIYHCQQTDEFFESEPSREQFDVTLEQAKQVLDFVVNRLPKGIQS